MPLEKLAEPLLLTDQVFAALRASIVDGDLPAGSRLRIRDVAARLGTSVMPVREAIQRLEEAGLAERVPHKGAVVKGLTLPELLHVYDVRRVLEVEAARLGAAAVTPGDLAALQTQYDRLRTAIVHGEATAVLDRDEDFLDVLYGASGNPVLTKTIRTLWEQCRSYKIVGARVTLQTADTTPLWRYPALLLAAARAGDAAQAAALTEESVRDAAARIRDQLTAPGAQG